MTVFFFGSDQATSTLQERFALILRTLRQTGLEVVTQSASPDASATGATFDAVDAVVIEGTTPSPEIGYFLAHAIAQKRPVLYLYQQGSGGDHILSYIRRKPNPYTIVARAYTERTLIPELSAFLEYLQGGGVKEAPALKFTLRITSSLERYLTYRADDAKTTKANYLRAYLEDRMREDEAYQRFLRSHPPTP